MLQQHLLILGAIPIQLSVKLKQQSTRMPSTSKNKMGGQCVATSTEITTPKTFLVNIQDIQRNVCLVLY